MENTDSPMGIEGLTVKSQRQIVGLGLLPEADSGDRHLMPRRELNGVRLNLVRLEHDNGLRQGGSRPKAMNQWIMVAVREEHPHTGVREATEPLDEPKLRTDVVLGFVVHVSGEHENLRLLGEDQVDQIIQGPCRAATDLLGEILVELTTQRLEWRPEVKISGMHHGADPAIFTLSHLRILRIVLGFEKLTDVLLSVVSRSEGVRH
jgi:hypothetical protein